MNILDSILFWAGIVLLVDGSLGLLFLEKWQRRVAKLNIRRIALVEIGMGLALLAGHYALHRWIAG